MPLKHNKLNKIYSLFLYSALVLFSYQQPLYADVLTSVNDWAKAWASQNVDQYFESYAEDFAPSQEHTKKTWKSQRESRLLSPSFSNFAGIIKKRQGEKVQQVKICFRFLNVD